MVFVGLVVVGRLFHRESAPLDFVDSSVIFSEEAAGSIFYEKEDFKERV